MGLLLVLVLAALLAAAFRVWQGRGDAAEARDPRSEATALWRRREVERARRREQARQRRLPPLPADDAPPAGLTPLVPSPRTVRVEAARGIREIEDWLADQTSA
ncbi:MAG TPA: hypothetical protein VNU26_09295 [Mycobacteriales bacterium]|nr:hypothetical protein [Mycobacteriales bacterium]